ncbi:MAG: lytic transglycosylase domain-containing protein [Actinobacteria bacterium]|nr:lytic transglycosylase domain-containing protein [Actinomycetota bacterium]
MPSKVVTGVVGLLIIVGTACEGGGGGQLVQPETDITTTSTTVTSATAAPVTAAPETPTTTVAPAAATTTAAPGTPIPTDQLKGPKTAAATARALAKIERKLRGSNRDPALLMKLGRAQQLAYRALSAHPAWVDDVLAEVDPTLQPHVQANVDAGAALSTLTGDAPAPVGFPQWVILTPEPAATLLSYYTEAEQTYGVPWQYLAAIHFAETRMGRIRGLSSAGAQGPMQFIPETWAAFGTGDINSNHDAILAAANYLDSNNAANDIDNALFRYNNDERYVAAIKLYAGVMIADPGAYDGYYHWQVFYASADGTFLLPEGWSAV